MPDSTADLSTLDMLRAFAVVLVVSCHLCAELGKFIPVGMIAVFFFFAHTSYVLMMSLERMHRTQPDRLWTRFMVRRVFRIYPLAVVMIAFVWVFRLRTQMRLDGSFYHVSVSAPDLVSNFLLTMNLTHSTVVHGVCWTLPLELQMYPLLPAIFFALQRSRRPLRLALAVWGVALLVAFIRPSLPHTSSFNVLDYAPMFLAGVIAFVIGGRNDRRIPFWVLPVALAAVAAVTVAIPSRYAWVADSPLVLGLAFLLPHVRETSSRAVRNVAHLISKYSYGIYLVHVIALSFGFSNRAPLPAKFLFFLLIVTVVPVVIYHLLEEPFVRRGRQLTDRSRAPVTEQAAAEAVSA